MPIGMDFFVAELSEEREEWKVDHDGAMECRDVEDLVRKGLGFFYMVRMTDESWTKKVQCGSTKFDANRVRQIRDAYLWWLSPCIYVLGQIQRVEINYAVEHAEEFRSSLRLARKIVAIDVDGLIESMQQADEGQLESLTEGAWGGLPD